MSEHEDWLRGLSAAVAGHFVLERELGPDGDAVTALARDLRLERPVVLNLLVPAFARDPVRRASFVARATLASRLAHPNIVPIHSVEAQGDLCWYVSGFIPGQSLRSRCRQEGPLPPSVAAQLARELLWAVAYAHEHGVIHGVLDPERIFLEENSGRALIAGLGTARGEVADPAADLHALARTVGHALRGSAPRDDDDLRLALADLPEWALRPLTEALATTPPGRPGTALRIAESLAPPVAPEIPKALQTWLDARNPLRVILVTWSLLSTVLWVVNSGGTIDTYLLDTWAPWLLVWPVAILQLRPVLREGFGRDDVLGVLDQQLRSRREEMGDRPVRRSNVLLTWVLLLGLLGIGATQISYDRIAHDVMQQFIVALVVLLFGTVLFRSWRDRAKTSRPRDEVMELRVAFWQGPLGRATFGMAGLGLRHRPQSPSAFDQRPTTLILADSIRGLARNLPKPLLRQFPNALATVDRLERAAEALRGRVARLEPLAAAGQPIGKALARAREHHRDALVALETLRLALLAAHGGAAQIGDGTKELEDAIALAARIEQLAQGKDEVEEVLHR